MIPHPLSDPTHAPVLNTHPMKTRSKFYIFQHQIHPSLLLSHSEPTNVKQALKDKNWQAAMQQEYDALISQRTWGLVPLPPARKAFGCK